MKKAIILPYRQLFILFTAIIAGLIINTKVFAQAEITAFNFEQSPTYTETINAGTQTIDVEIYNSADITELTAVFVVSGNAIAIVGSVVQTSGVTVNDFTNQVSYIVTSQDGTLTKEWKVNVTKRPPSSDKQLLSFQFVSIPGSAGVIDEATHSVSVTIPYSQDVTALVASFTLSPLSTARIGTVTQVTGSSTNDYTNTVTFTTVAENGSTRNYYITVNHAAIRTEKVISLFAFAGLEPAVEGVIDQTNFTIALTVPFEVNVTNLVANFENSYLSTVTIGGVAQFSGLSSNNFEAAVIYTVTAENGSTQDYTVNVTKAAASTAAEITSYKLRYNGEEVDAVITGTSIAATVPYAWDINNLVAVFEISNFAISTVGGSVQVSGVTVNNFASNVTYAVMAQDVSVTKQFIVAVSQPPASQANDMLSFMFDASLNGVLNSLVVGIFDNVNKTISLTVPYGTPVSALIPTFTSSPLSVVKVADVAQESQVTPQNFTNPVLYQVVAEDGSIEHYTVSVLKAAASQENQLIAYKFILGTTDYVGVLDQTNQTVTIHVPYGTNVASLTATFTVSPFASVQVSVVQQVSGLTSNNFTNPVVYSIFAQDGSVELYTVTVIVDPNTEKKFLSFDFSQLNPPVTGSINETNHTISLQVANSTNVTALAAYFVVSPNAKVYTGGIEQTSGVTTNDFSANVSYTVIAENGTSENYLVIVTRLPIQTGKAITAFSFAAFDPAIVATIDEANHTIEATLPLGTPVSALVATFTNSLLSTVAVAGTSQTSGTTANNFTNPLIYTVTAEDASTQAYTVTVTVLPPSSEKNLLSFTFEDFNPIIVGIINHTLGTVEVTVPHGTDKTALRASFTSSEFSSVSIPGGGNQQSGLVPNDFTGVVSYDVNAQDGTIKRYLVTVSEAADVTSPVVTALTQSVTNRLYQFVLVSSNEATGKIYIIEKNSPQSSVADLESSVAAGKGKYVFVTSANVDIPISTFAMKEGVYYAFAIDGSSNMSARGVNPITIVDDLPPTIYISAQIISNAPNNSVLAQSSEGEGFIYLIKEGVSQSTMAELEAAVASKNGSKGYVFSPLTNITLQVVGLNPGNYHAYAVDNNSNISDPSSQIIIITAASRLKSMSSYSFLGTTPPSIGGIAGNLIEVEVPYGTPVNNLVASFTTSDKAKAYVGLVEQISGVTVNDFTGPITYTVEAEDGTTLDYTITVTVASGTGVEDLEWGDHIQVYPNPVQDQLHIALMKPVDRIIVIDLLGQVVADMNEPSSNLIHISTQTWTKGLYVVRFYRNNEAIYHSKLIKQ